MKTKGKAFWLFLVTAVLLTVFLLPQPTFAQGRTDLTLTLLPYRYNFEITAGKDNLFYLEVRNTGTTTVTNIRLSSDKPEGWVIDFRPDRIDSLSPGSLQTVDVNIKPSGDAAKGELRVNIIATANEIRKVESLWVTVKIASYWLWVGIGIAVVVVAAFIFIFMRFGRQK
jgi:uncharacterized membrane protein